MDITHHLPKLLISFFNQQSGALENLEHRLMAVMLLLMHEQEHSTTAGNRGGVEESGALAAKAKCAELQPCREQSLYKDEE